jgi:hypothetical protein
LNRVIKESEVGQQELKKRRELPELDPQLVLEQGNDSDRKETEVGQQNHHSWAALGVNGGHDHVHKS